MPSEADKQKECPVIDEAIRDACWRCRDVADAWPADSYNIGYGHGVDDHDGVTLGPEECPADFLWRVRAPIIDLLSAVREEGRREGEAAQSERIERLEKDRERLDWLEERFNGHRVAVSLYSYGPRIEPFAIATGPLDADAMTVREAIDAALLSEGATYHWDQRDGDYYSIKCPTCDRVITKDVRGTRMG